jgi:membrane protein implicated in regulation of membrane protease activity
MGFLRGAGYLGVIGVATAIAAILGTQDVDAWVVGVVSSSVALVLAWILRRSLVA